MSTGPPTLLVTKEKFTPTLVTPSSQREIHPDPRSHASRDARIDGCPSGCAWDEGEIEPAIDFSASDGAAADSSDRRLASREARSDRRGGEVRHCFARSKKQRRGAQAASREGRADDWNRGLLCVKQSPMPKRHRSRTDIAHAATGARNGCWLPIRAPGGELCVTPAPGTTHRRIVRDLEFILHSRVSAGGLGEVLDALIDVIFSVGRMRRAVPGLRAAAVGTGCHSGLRRVAVDPPLHRRV